MAGERKFIRESTNRILIKEFLIKKVEGAGFGGMTIKRTPMGTRINMVVERPGMVIGKGGSKIKQITADIREKFDVDNPQIEIQEAGSTASLNAQIMAEKLAEALERGWHFRRAGHSTVRRIMGAGGKGCQVVIAGKLTGSRHRTEKFTQGHIKYCGETAKQVMDRGFAVAKLKAGVLGVKVSIMKPDSKLPDEIEIRLPKTEKKDKKSSKKEKKEKTEEARKEKTKTKQPAPSEKKEETKEKPTETDIDKLTDIPGIGPSIVKKFKKAGVSSLEEVFEMDADDLASIDGIGGKTAETIIKELKKILE
ncbi:MAG: 30S ribosomal protein S3 [Candidatus Thermoplasmatota archaeon]|nr:30S ribosomal protein S3 [Candidatus Thermoplasmatota archaeon]MBS3801196.1 30S ribosomal protein S3 [Candidatus Thermoplasmatota archaeon]